MLLAVSDAAEETGEPDFHNGEYLPRQPHIRNVVVGYIGKNSLPDVLKLGNEGHAPITCKVTYIVFNHVRLCTEGARGDVIFIYCDYACC